MVGVSVWVVHWKMYILQSADTVFNDPVYVIKLIIFIYL